MGVVWSWASRLHGEAEEAQGTGVPGQVFQDRRVGPTSDPAAWTSAPPPPRVPSALLGGGGVLTA